MSYNCSWCGRSGHNVVTCPDKKVGRGLRCLRCRAYRDSKVHHVRGATFNYMPKGCVAYDAAILQDWVKIKLNQAGYCQICEKDRHGEVRRVG